MSSHPTNYEPFGELMSFGPLRNIEDIFREFQKAALRPDAPPMRLDVGETEQAYTVNAEIPGVRKEDIRVDVDGNRVSISAERNRESEEQQGNVIRSERQWGRQYRSFVLQVPVDESKVDARYEDGVLKLTMPKKTDTGTRRIAIN